MVHLTSLNPMAGSLHRVAIRRPTFINPISPKPSFTPRFQGRIAELSKDQRIGVLAERLMTLPPFQNDTEAFQAMTTVLAGVERDYRPASEPEDMAVEPEEFNPAFTVQGHPHLRVGITPKHIVLIHPNGALKLYEARNPLTQKTPLPLERAFLENHFSPLLDKPNARQQRVWD